MELRRGVGRVDLIGPRFDIAFRSTIAAPDAREFVHNGLFGRVETAPQFLVPASEVRSTLEADRDPDFAHLTFE